MTLKCFDATGCASAHKYGSPELWIIYYWTKKKKSTAFFECATNRSPAFKKSRACHCLLSSLQPVNLEPKSCPHTYISDRFCEVLIFMLVHEHAFNNVVMCPTDDPIPAITMGA